MGLMDVFKTRSAILKQQKGDTAAAKAEYEKLYAAGKIDPAYLLPYTVLLLREGGEENYLKVKEILKKVDKVPGLPADRKQQVHLNYACAQYKLGNVSEAINLLEASHKKTPCGSTYGALGFLYVEAGDVEKGLAYNQEALEYDDEDPVVQDNMGQLYYRVIGDKEKALGYFQKAHELKPGQIDTLYFLSRYDLEKGDKNAAIEKLETALDGRFSPLNYVTPELISQEIEKIKASGT